MYEQVNDIYFKVNGYSNITELLVKKYKTIYNSVKTSEKYYCGELHSVIAGGVTSLEVSDYQVKPYIIEHCIKRLKHNKDDGSIEFNSNHLLYGGKRLHVLLSLVFSSFFCYEKNYLMLSLAMSVRPSVRRAVCPSVCPSVRRLWKYLWNAVLRDLLSRLT